VFPSCHVTHIQQNLFRQVRLETKTPGLLIGYVPADVADRPDGVSPDIIEKSVRGPGRWRNATNDVARRRRCLAGSIFQCVVGCGMIKVESRDPGGLHIKSLIPPRSSACRAAPWRGEVESRNRRGTRNRCAIGTQIQNAAELPCSRCSSSTYRSGSRRLPPPCRVGSPGTCKGETTFGSSQFIAVETLRPRQ